MKKKSFEVPKSFINENFSEPFLFRQLIKSQLILVLHRLVCFNQKTTLKMKSVHILPNKTYDKSVLLESLA